MYHYAEPVLRSDVGDLDRQSDLLLPGYQQYVVLGRCRDELRLSAVI
jgi:hypothetical protein